MQDAPQHRLIQFIGAAPSEARPWNVFIYIVIVIELRTYTGCTGREKPFTQPPKGLGY